MIQRNPTTKANSARKLAKKLGIDTRQAWEILRQDLGLKPWKYQKRQKLNAQTKQKRLDSCRALLRRSSRGRHRQIIFSDEKLFDIQQVGVWVIDGAHLVFSVFQSPKRQDLDRRRAGHRRKGRRARPESRVGDGLGSHLLSRQEPFGLCGPRHEDQSLRLHGHAAHTLPP